MATIGVSPLLVMQGSAKELHFIRGFASRFVGKSHLAEVWILHLFNNTVV